MKVKCNENRKCHYAGQNLSPPAHRRRRRRRQARRCRHHTPFSSTFVWPFAWPDHPKKVITSL